MCSTLRERISDIPHEDVVCHPLFPSAIVPPGRRPVSRQSAWKREVLTRSGKDRTLLRNLTSMGRLPMCMAVVVGVFAACTGSPREEPASRAEVPSSPAANVDAYRMPPTPLVPETEADRLIRRDLNLAISQDPSLRDRQISFLVSNGDVSVTGIVKNEGERKRINDLAMDIDGVKSVANALRVSE
jgi:hypothetical protein